MPKDRTSFGWRWYAGYAVSVLLIFRRWLGLEPAFLVNLDPDVRRAQLRSSWNGRWTAKSIEMAMACQMVMLAYFSIVITSGILFNPRRELAIGFLISIYPAIGIHVRRNELFLRAYVDSRADLCRACGHYLLSGAVRCPECGEERTVAGDSQT